MRTVSDQPQTVVLGRYALGGVVGRGATSVVRRARDLHSDREVAVKAVPVELGLAQRVAAEARAAGRLDHPAVVALLDHGHDDECFYLVWELIDGPSLAACLAGGNRPTDPEAIAAMGQVFDALAHAHQRSVIHRDVKPANILLDRAGNAHLTDFGVARLLGEPGLTMTGGVVGTVAYMAPEQARGEQVSTATDVYAAGLVLYECLAGANPHADPAPAEIARRAASGRVPPLTTARPDLAADLCRAVDACLTPDPSLRPAAAWVADQLAACVGGPRAAARRGWRLVPRLACAAVGAGIGIAAVRVGAPADWATTGPLALAGLGGGVVAALAPRAAAFTAVLGACAVVAVDAPALGALLAAVALVVLMAGLGHGRLMLLPALAPLLFAMGLGPLYAAIVGWAPRWGARLWAALAGALLAAVWQVLAGGGALLAAGGYASVDPADLTADDSLPDLMQRLWEPYAANPAPLAQPLVLAAAALCVPVVARLRVGGPRGVGAAAWVIGLGTALAVTAFDPIAAVGAMIPTAVIVMVWAIWPWNEVLRNVRAKVSATLRR